MNNRGPGVYSEDNIRGTIYQYDLLACIVNWINILNTGANLYQAGAVTSLASTQNQMLSFQINQSVSDNLRNIELVETRRMVVQLTGILEDAMDYIPTHASYTGVVIPICAEFAKSLNIDEGNFDEASDMALARSLKRVIRRSKADLHQIWNENIASESVKIGDSLTKGRNVEQFSESWIPDEGELLGELYSLIAKFQERKANVRFAVYHIKKKGRQNFFRVDDGNYTHEIRLGPPGLLGGKIRIMDDQRNIISSNHKMNMGMMATTYSGNFVLPNGSNFQYQVKIGGVMSVKSATFTNDRMMTYVVDPNASPPLQS